jgi:hypothetical protein
VKDLANPIFVSNVDRSAITELAELAQLFRNVVLLATPDSIRRDSEKRVFYLRLRANQV